MSYPDTPASSVIWLESRWSRVERFLLERFHPDSRAEVANFFLSDPVFFKRFIEFNFDFSEETRFLFFLKMLHQKSLIIPVLGKRGSGKTCSVHYLLRCYIDFFEYIGVEGEPRPIYFVDTPSGDPKFLFAPTLSAVPGGAICVVDEGAIQFGSRSFKDKDNIDMGAQLKILRHNHRTIIVITQNTAELDINLIRAADALIFKPTSLLQAKTERDEIFHPCLSYLLPRTQSELLFWSDDIVMLLQHQPHQDWNDELSKSWKPIIDDDQAREYFQALIEDDVPYLKAKQKLRFKLYKASDETLIAWAQKVRPGYKPSLKG